MQHKLVEPRSGIEDRHESILRTLRMRGYTAIEDLALETGVTPQTIRRDLQFLSAEGLVRRHHGGASLPSSVANTEYALRLGENAEAKAAIGRAALALVPDGSSVFMTLGTTVQAAAVALATRRELVVVTNHPRVAEALGPVESMAVHMTGGRVSRTHGGLVGPAAAEVAARWRCDLLLTSGGGLSSDGWLLEYHEDEVCVTCAMAENARRVVVLADHTKFGRWTARKMLPLGRMGALVTDRAPPADFRRLAERQGVELIIAPPG